MRGRNLLFASCSPRGADGRHGKWLNIKQLIDEKKVIYGLDSKKMENARKRAFHRST
jgi:hypothetical protein